MSNLGGNNVSEDTDRDSGTVDTIVAGTNITVDSTDPKNPIVASTGTSATFHGALVEEADSVSRGSSNFVPDFDTVVYDTDSFADLGTEAGHLTIPAGVTKVQVTATIDASSIAANSDKAMDIQHRNDGGLIRAYGTNSKSTGTASYITLTTPVISVTEGDHFQISATCSDSSWSQIYAALAIEYKDGTL